MPGVLVRRKLLKNTVSAGKKLKFPYFPYSLNSFLTPKNKIKKKNNVSSNADFFFF